MLIRTIFLVVLVCSQVAALLEGVPSSKGVAWPCQARPWILAKRVKKDTIAAEEHPLTLLLVSILATPLLSNKAHVWDQEQGRIVGDEDSIVVRHPLAEGTCQLHR